MFCAKGFQKTKFSKFPSGNYGYQAAYKLRRNMNVGEAAISYVFDLRKDTNFVEIK